MIVAPWGKGLRDDFSTEVLGHLIAVDLKTKSISTIGSGKPVGNLDGLESDGNGKWLTTDWVAGALWRIDADGDAELLMDMNQGSADIGVINSEAMVLLFQLVKLSGDKINHLHKAMINAPVNAVCSCLFAT